MPTRQPALLRAASLTIAALVGVGIGGCSAAVRPADTARHLSAGGRYSCQPGESVALGGHSRTFMLSGSCGAVTVNGDGITVRLARATSLDVLGRSDSITVDDRVGSVIVKGTGVSLDAGSIGSIQVTGQGNSVTSAALGSVAVQGDHNAVMTHLKPSDYRVTGEDNTLTLR